MTTNNKINLKLVTLTQTCLAFPSQWEGQLEDGRYIYIRFRWGRLGYGIGNSPEDAINNYDWWNGKNVGRHGFDGELEEKRMLRLLGLKK